MTAERPAYGDQFDSWFPRVQRAVVLLVGTGGIIYGTAMESIELLATFLPLLLWQGYQELRRAGRQEEPT